jgi:hypothetical protein
MRRPLVTLRSPAMTEELLARLDDDDPFVRQDAAVALGDLGNRAAKTVDVFRLRLLSPNMTYHDRCCAAWVLWQIAGKGNKAVINELLHVLRTEITTPDADNLRCYCGYAIEELATDYETLEIVRRSRETDPYWIEVARLTADIPDVIDGQ